MRFSTIVVLIIISSFSCSKRNPVRTKCELPCEKNLMCTYEFRSIGVEVSDLSGNGVKLDDFAIVRKSDNKVITVDQQPMIHQEGRYMLFSDSYMKETSRCGEDFEFKGYKNKQMIVSRTFNIAHNCCHIYLVSGDTKIIVN